MTFQQAIRSLEGVSIGDGYGAAQGELILRSEFSIDLPPGPWRWTDDTAMAISIVENLKEHGAIEQESLATGFAKRYMDEPLRGYAGHASELLYSVWNGIHWKLAAVMKFPEGSWGNGGAMRAAPIGAFFSGDPERAAAEAELSAEITHAHIEGKAGAIAVAAAAAIVSASPQIEPLDLIEQVASFTPESETKRVILLGRGIEPRDVEVAAVDLGVGWDISAQGTVPFCIWMAAHYMSTFEGALMLTASMGGDCDTTCAIVGGIVATVPDELPAEWLSRTEPLPAMV